MNDLDQTRAKILGDLIHDARLQAGRSVADCANALGVSEELFSQAESGDYNPTLPDLEVLAMYLNVPMAHFWGNITLEVSGAPNFENFAKIRQRIIGALLRQARVQSKRSVQEAADHVGGSVKQIEAYESGMTAVPLFELERLGKYLGVALDYFSDEARGPLGQHEARQKMLKRFDELSPEVKKFVIEPINLSYIETAMRLSVLDVKRLRNIAEGILDITF
jgi:transcriptional regulator with XRE-family HTH domain